MDRENKVYSVCQINHYIKGLFSQDVLLNRVFVRGEVTNCKYHHSGHVYFSLKDESGILSCILFAGNRRGLSFPMKDGDTVIVSGNIDVFERDGRYQLYAKEIEAAGEGELYAKFLALKAELAEAGMFDEMYKKAIPRYAKRIGIVTAASGAAIRDIENVAGRRNPFVQLCLCPAQVQGEGAAESIASAIAALNRMPLDLIIVGRGGGSMEDLWAFNEETVARAIFESELPVVSAVGHETDTTIADFVADLRAPTPSAAAELAVFPIEEFDADLQRYRQKLTQAVCRKTERSRQSHRLYEANLSALRPAHLLQGKRHELAEMEIRLQNLCRERLRVANERRAKAAELLPLCLREKSEDRRRRYLLYLERLKGENPLERLRKGYAYVTDGAARPVRQVAGLKAGDCLRLRLTDGSVTSRILEVEQDV